jgi:hypothetical protein
VVMLVCAVPRLLFVLDGTGPAGITTHIHALHAAAKDPALPLFLHTVPILAAALADLRTKGPCRSSWFLLMQSAVAGPSHRPDLCTHGNRSPPAACRVAERSALQRVPTQDA